MGISPRSSRFLLTIRPCSTYNRLTHLLQIQRLLAGRTTITHQREGPAAPLNIPVPLASASRKYHALLGLLVLLLTTLTTRSTPRGFSFSIHLTFDGISCSNCFVCSIRVKHLHYSNRKRKDLDETIPLKPNTLLAHHVLAVDSCWGLPRQVPLSDHTITVCLTMDLSPCIRGFPRHSVTSSN